VREGRREASEDLGELGAQQRGRDVGREEVEEIDGSRRRVFACDSLRRNLVAEQRQQRSEVGGWREVGLLLAECVLDGCEQDVGLTR
jgi:hypothetical protein